VRMIDKKAESVEQLTQTSIRYPKFRLEQRRNSGREVLAIKGVKKAFGDNQVLHGVDLTVARGDRLAVMGPNGIGKSTLLKIVMGQLTADAGDVEWGYETHPGYFAQDHQEEFETRDGTAEEWVWGFCPDRDFGYVRGVMGLMLFSGDDGNKPLRALSGGEATRLVFTRLSIEQPNVLVLDEPTNHLDLESIEALVEGLKAYPGTVILVSHDRWFVSQLATRILEIRADNVTDYPGSYDEYVHACGDDHLDVDHVVLKARREKRRKQTSPTTKSAERPPKRKNPKRDLEKRRQTLSAIMQRIEAVETRVQEIDDLFCEPDYFARTPVDEARDRQAERNRLQLELRDLISEWETIESQVNALETRLESR
ncbi:MAG: ATP-binding cassette domain-containing protein, partial [Gemmatimonadota bacterium]